MQGMKLVKTKKRELGVRFWVEVSINDNENRSETKIYGFDYQITHFFHIELILTFLIEAKIPCAQAGSFDRITHWVIFICSVLYHILDF